MKDPGEQPDEEIPGASCVGRGKPLCRHFLTGKFSEARNSGIVLEASSGASRAAPGKSGLHARGPTLITRKTHLS